MEVISLCVRTALVCDHMTGSLQRSWRSVIKENKAVTPRRVPREEEADNVQIQRNLCESVVLTLSDPSLFSRQMLHEGLFVYCYFSLLIWPLTQRKCALQPRVSDSARPFIHHADNHGKQRGFYTPQLR